ncbi:MAG: hypothetical protein ACPLKQ_04615 [Candidatus Bathyarchaeales archaeon]
MRKNNLNFAKTSGFITLALGAASLIASILYNSQILAFIGLGLTFWGVILTYIQTEEYVKGSLLPATCLSALETLNKIMEELGYKEKAIYLPPKYLADPEANKAYIPKNRESPMPTPEQTQGKENRVFLQNPQSIILTPPGSELTKLFEKTLETSFTKLDLQNLQLNLPKLLIEDLEIAQNLDVTVENNKVTVTVENSAYQSLTKEAAKLSKLYESLGCPLSSAIACAIAKATGKPVTIEKQQIIDENKALKIEYLLIEEAKTGQ